MANQRLKYIAEGFPEDSANLLKDFAVLNTVEFSEFAAVWRKHQFSLIFMGRPDHTETSEFVNEIFSISSQYLFLSSFYEIVGAVYLLYALFRNQISEPKIMIRLELCHWKVIRTLRNDAIMNKYTTLHYVIDYLMKHAFLYVACQTLKGPLTSTMPKTSRSQQPHAASLKVLCKTRMTNYSINNNLTDLCNLTKEILAEKKKFDSTPTELSETVYENALDELHQILNPVCDKKRKNIGQNRAKIKDESFKRKCKDRLGNVSATEEEIQTNPGPSNEAMESPNRRKPRTRRPRRRPKHERKVGRPRIHPKKEPPSEPKDDDDDVDISHLLKQQNEFYLPPVNNDRKTRSKRDAYYQLSPKEENSDSD